MDIKLKKINDFTQEMTCKVSWEELEDSFKNEFDKVKSNHTPLGGRKGKVFGRDLELFKNAILLRGYEPSNFDLP